MPETVSTEHLPQPKPFDQEWYNRFAEVGSFQAYDYLEDSGERRRQERSKFEAGEVENPTLEYPEISLTELNELEDALRTLKADVLKGPVTGAPVPEKLEVVQKAYRWRINEKLAEVGLLRAAAEGNAQRFSRYSRFIYGSPSPEVFAYTVNSLRRRLAGHVSSDNAELATAAERLSELLPSNLPDPQLQALPSAETFAAAREQTQRELGHIIMVPDTAGEVDAAVIQQAFEAALTELKSEGWSVLVTPDRSRISVNQERREVLVPQERRMKPDKLKGLVLHEIGTHIARRDSGSRSRLRLLELGLDRYESGEEGLATMREQVTQRQQLTDFTALDRHLAISLALGLDGTPRDFRQVYEIIYQYNLVVALEEGKQGNKAEAEAREESWVRCVRTFRGTDCKTAGAAFTKDIIYREGNMGVWDLIRTNPSEMKRFNVGKYDPTNPRHIWILTELGITEADLENLEKE